MRIVVLRGYIILSFERFGGVCVFVCADCANALAGCVCAYCVCVCVLCVCVRIARVPVLLQSLYSEN